MNIIEVYKLYLQAILHFQARMLIATNNAFGMCLVFVNIYVQVILLFCYMHCSVSKRGISFFISYFIFTIL